MEEDIWIKMSHKKNIRFKVEAKTGKLVRKFNVKLVVELDENDMRWFSHIDNPKEETEEFYLFIEEIFSTAFQIIINGRSHMFEKVYSSRFNLDFTVYTKNMFEGKEVNKYYIYVGVKHKKENLVVEPRDNNLFMMVPTNLLLGQFNNYKNKKQNKKEIILEITTAVIHEMTHLLDPLAAKILRQEIKEITELDLLRVEGLATFQQTIYEPKEFIIVGKIKSYHQNIKRYFDYNLKQIKGDAYYFGFYMCLIMFTHFIKEKNNALYEQLYQVVFSGNPDYEILFAELKKDETRRLSVIFKQIVARQSTKTFFKKFYETAIVLKLDLACLPEIKELIEKL